MTTIILPRVCSILAPRGKNKIEFLADCNYTITMTTPAVPKPAGPTAADLMKSLTQISINLDALTARVNELDTTLLTKLGEKMVESYSGLTVTIEGLTTQISNIERLTSAVKKRTKIAGAEGSVPVAATESEGVALPDGPKKYSNKMFFFVAQFKSSQEWRDTYMTPEIAGAQALLELTKGKKADAVLTAQGRYCWNAIRNGKPAEMDKITAAFDQHNKSVAGPAATQLTVEADSPTKTAPQ